MSQNICYHNPRFSASEQANQGDHKVKRSIITLLICVIFSGIAVAEVDIYSIKNSGPISRELNLLFIKGMSREKLRSYDDALYAYNVILARVQGMVNSSRTPNESVAVAMPYAIAAAYRKGIVTHRMVEGNVVKLFTQLKMYEDCEKWTNEVLTEISNIEFERGIKVPETQYGMLYFSRAYNKMGWAYALFNGSYWKRYLIYTPADTVLMVDKSMDDLSRMFAIYKPNFKDRAVVAIGSAADASVDLDENTVTSNELVTFSLCYNTDSLNEIKGLMGRQIGKNVKGVMELYSSKDISNDLATGRKLFTYEDLVDARSRDVAVAMAKLLKEMGTN